MTLQYNNAPVPRDSIIICSPMRQNIINKSMVCFNSTITIEGCIKYWDREVIANSAEPDQTAPEGAV